PKVEFGEAITLRQLQRHFAAQLTKNPKMPPQWRGFGPKGFYYWSSPDLKPLFGRSVLYIGEIRPEQGNTLIGRLRQHVQENPSQTDQTGDAKLSRLLKGKPVDIASKSVRLNPDRIFVQPGRIVGARGEYDIDRNADHHAIEHQLKIRLNPLLNRYTL